MRGEEDGAVLARARDGRLDELLALDVEGLCFFKLRVRTDLF